MPWLALVLWLTIVASPFIAWAIFGRKGYKRVLLDRPPPGWRQTAEAFQDPVSGDPATVWSSPDGSERAYVRAPPR